MEKHDVEQVHVIQNHIYFYGDVNENNSLLAIKAINELNNSKKISKHLDDIYKSDDDTNDHIIFFHINSNGGCFTDGIAIYDTIRLSNKPVYTIGEGAIGSMASVILLAGKKRFMTENSFILIHEVRCFFNTQLTLSNIKDEYFNIKLFTNKIKKIYKNKTKINSFLLNKLLKKDIWMSSTKALKNGFVDKIV
jgi:ATP-dependent Clp endopeptidase proteolytic subunit ClpP